MSGTKLLKTTDGGDSWFEVSTGLPCIYDLVGDPLRAGVLYSACFDVQESLDGGLSWSPVDPQSLPAVALVNAIEVSASSPRVVNVGTTQGVYSNTTDLRLDVAGSCPGTVTVDIWNAPPNSEVGVVAATNTNGFVKGGVLCNGTVFEIGEPFQLPPTWIQVDGAGNGSGVANLPANRCWLEALALANCATSSAEQVP